jgi:hypothetical protein
MKMRENMQDIYKAMTNSEELIRLLYYKASNSNDDILDSSKPNILDMPELEKWEIIRDRIKNVPKVDDLDKEPKCRLCFYPGNRQKTNSYLVSDQDITIDILVHFDYEDMDQRMEWICDVVNDLIFDKKITGTRKVLFSGGGSGVLRNTPQSYVGYRLVYSFGSVNK